jgi:hypothetical protein
LVRERLGGVASAELLIRSFNFADIEALQQAGRWDDAGRLLAQAATNLADGGADAIVICTNTMHRLADVVAAAVDTPDPHRRRHRRGGEGGRHRRCRPAGNQIHQGAGLLRRKVA